MLGHRMLLMRLGLLESLSEEQISAVLESLARRELASDEPLFVQGERCEHLHLIQYGSIQLASELGGTQRTLEIVSAGQVLGEVGVFLAMPYPCSAVAVEESLVASLHQNDLRRLASDVPGFCWQVFRLLSKRLVGAHVRVQALSSPNIRVRVGAVLLQLAQEASLPARGRPVVLRLRQDEVAQMAGVRRETVSRLVAEWSGAGLVIAGRGRITIPDVGRFQDVVERLTSQTVGQHSTS